MVENQDALMRILPLKDKELEHENVVNPSCKRLTSDWDYLVNIPLGKFNHTKKELDLDDVVKLSHNDLSSYTDGFSEDKYIGDFQFGKFYRGKIVGAQFTKDVLVKIYEANTNREDNKQKLMDEVVLLSHEMMFNHPGMPKLYGYCLEGDHVGVVFDFNPFASVYDLTSNRDFTWLQRIKVALKLAFLFEYLNGRKCTSYKPFVIRNLSSKHVMVDEDYNPKLCDFSRIAGGIFGDAGKFSTLREYYIDCPIRGENWTPFQDMRAFGFILFGLISKRDLSEKDERGYDLVHWAWANVNDHERWESDVKPKLCLVHGSFEDDPNFDRMDAEKISRLARECVKNEDREQKWRPSMRLVIKSLHKLKVVKKNAEFFGVENGYIS